MRATRRRPAGMAPLIVGLLVVVIGMTWGYNAGYAINPARDFGPRLFSVRRRLGQRGVPRRQFVVVGTDRRTGRSAVSLAASFTMR